MNAIYCKNVQYCCEKYGINFDSVINCNFSVNNFENMCFASSTDGTTIIMVHELMCLDNSFKLCNDFLTRLILISLLNRVCTS